MLKVIKFEDLRFHPTKLNTDCNLLSFKYCKVILILSIKLSMWYKKIDKYFYVFYFKYYI